MSLLKKAESLLGKSILGVCAVGMAVITAIICLQVLYRYILGSSLSWAEEFSLYLEVYIVFLAGGYALGSGQHICMDLVVNLVPRPVAFLFHKLTAVACLAYSLAMTYFCWTFMMAETDQKMAALPGYKWMAYLALVIGAVLMVIYSIVLILQRPADEAAKSLDEGGDE